MRSRPGRSLLLVCSERGAHIPSVLHLRVAPTPGKVPEQRQAMGAAASARQASEWCVDAERHAQQLLKQAQAAMEAWVAEAQEEVREQLQAQEEVREQLQAQQHGDQVSGSRGLQQEQHCVDEGAEESSEGGAEHASSLENGASLLAGEDKGPETDGEALGHW